MIDGEQEFQKALNGDKRVHGKVQRIEMRGLRGGTEKMRTTWGKTDASIPAVRATTALQNDITVISKPNRGGTPPYAQNHQHQHHHDWFSYDQHPLNHHHQEQTPREHYPRHQPQQEHHQHHQHHQEHHDPPHQFSTAFSRSGESRKNNQNTSSTSNKRGLPPSHHTMVLSLYGDTNYFYQPHQKQDHQQEGQNQQRGGPSPVIEPICRKPSSATFVAAYNKRGGGVQAAGEGGGDLDFAGGGDQHSAASFSSDSCFVAEDGEDGADLANSTTLPKADVDIFINHFTSKKNSEG